MLFVRMSKTGAMHEDINPDQRSGKCVRPREVDQHVRLTLSPATYEGQDRHMLPAQGADKVTANEPVCACHRNTHACDCLKAIDSLRLRVPIYC
jgi:hypothetical protein